MVLGESCVLITIDCLLNGLLHRDIEHCCMEIVCRSEKVLKPKI